MKEAMEKEGRVLRMQRKRRGYTRGRRRVYRNSWRNEVQEAKEYWG
jgi:hypothetical protein